MIFTGILTVDAGKGIRSGQACNIRQEAPFSACVFIRAAADDRSIQLTVLNQQHFPVRMIPFAPGSLHTGQQVQLSGLPSGKYILRITVDGSTTEEEIVIKQR